MDEILVEYCWSMGEMWVENEKFRIWITISEVQLWISLDDRQLKLKKNGI